MKGFEFLREDKAAEELGVFRVFSRLYPQEPRAWNGLGDAYIARADTVNAVASFREALKLQPENARAAAALKWLGK